MPYSSRLKPARSFAQRAGASSRWRFDSALAASTYRTVVGCVPVAHHRFPAPSRRETGGSPELALTGLLLKWSRSSPSSPGSVDNALSLGAGTELCDGPQTNPETLSQLARLLGS